MSFEFSTARLWLRPYGLPDVDALRHLWTNPGVRRFLWDDVVIPRERAAAVVSASVADWQREGLGQWTVWLRQERELIGFCGFRWEDTGTTPELLYGLAPAHWGQGLATEAAEAALAYAFDVRGVEQVWAATDPPNTASVRVLERLGMRFERLGDLDGLPALFYRLRRVEFQNRERAPLRA